jgi:hypothetical protein
MEGVRSPDDVRAVFRLFASGRSPAEISHSTGVSMSTIKRWLHQGPEVLFASPRRRVECDGSTDCSIVRDAPHGPYAYLLGQYLGDGHIVRSRNVYRLEITCCATYPAIVEECADAIARVLPMNSVGRRDRPGVIQVGCYSKHLPCLFPQHGAGPKHQRPIVLRP